MTGRSREGAEFRTGVADLWLAIRKSLEGPENDGRNREDFDKQPYLELEQFCRQAGNNGLADTVYFDLRKKERETESRFLFQIWDWFERGVFGYGVKPVRMLCWFSLALIGGALILSAAAGTKLTPDQFARAMVASFGNLVPGLEDFLKPDLSTRGGVGIAVFQRVIGWALLALLAHRFFKGLKK